MNLGKLNSYFGEGTVLKGSLKFKGVLRFDGDFEGDIATDDTLIIGETGIVKATLGVGSLHNFGKVNGDVDASKNISLHANSKLEGNIRTPSLMTEDMARFEGACSMPVVERPDHSEADMIAAAMSGPAQTVNPYELVGKEPPVKESFLAAFTLKQKASAAGAGALLIILIMIWAVFGGEKKSPEKAAEEAAVTMEKTQTAAKQEIVPQDSGAVKAVSDNDIAKLKKDIEADAKNPHPHQILSKIYLGKRDYKNAVATLEQGVAAIPGNEELVTLAGQTLHRSGREKEALKYFISLAQINPNSAEAINNTAFQKMESGALDQSAELFRSALAKDPANFRSKIGLAAVYSKQEENAKAIQECANILKEADDYSPAMNRLAWIYAKQGNNLKEAQTLSEKSLAIYADIPEYIDTLSEVNFKLGNYNESIKLIKRAIELAPAEPYYKRQLFKYQRTQKGKAQPAPKPEPVM
ncbi:MAG: polymer-forming cytoskeletal protein [Nitrospinae bacterium]|nr:polymer-forming cytoskeletal protein [Nitrospinota bacterium]